MLIRKKDGSLCFCIDYRSLKSVTKQDKFSLLLNQLANQTAESVDFTDYHEEFTTARELAVHSIKAAQEAVR